MRDIHTAHQSTMGRILERCEMDIGAPCEYANIHAAHVIHSCGVWILVTLFMRRTKYSLRVVANIFSYCARKFWNTWHVIECTWQPPHKLLRKYKYVYIPGIYTIIYMFYSISYLVYNAWQSSYVFVNSSAVVRCRSSKGFFLSHNFITHVEVLNCKM